MLGIDDYHDQYGLEQETVKQLIITAKMKVVP